MGKPRKASRTAVRHKTKRNEKSRSRVIRDGSGFLRGKVVSKKERSKIKGLDYTKPQKEERIMDAGNDGDDDDEDREASYEKRPRTSATSTERWNTKDNVSKLPVKGENGTLQSASLVVGKGDDDDDDEDGSFMSLVRKRNDVDKEEDDNNNDGNENDSDSDSENGNTDTQLTNSEAPGKNPKQPVILNAAALHLMRGDKKKEIATLSETILADPQQGVAQSKDLQGGSHIRKLIHFAQQDQDSTIRKYAVLSLVAVFRDILPGYRIRLETEKERKAQKTKQVRLLRRFERNLLEAYQAFLKHLHRVTVEILGPIEIVKDHRAELLEEEERQQQGDVTEKKKKKGKKLKGLSEALVAVRAMCTMLVSKPSFNFRENLLIEIVPRMNSLYPAIRAQCCACISTLLQEDVAGDATLEVVTFINKFVNARNHGLNGSVHPDVCKVLLQCDLKGDLKDIQRLEKARIERKTKKRKRKSGDDISLGLEEAQAGIDQYQRHAKNVEALKELFIMYLRVLKRAPQSVLMSVVLRGVSRFVHLINLEIAQALVAALTGLVKSDTLSSETGLQCVHTIAMTLRGPGSELNVDESEFVAYLYRLMMRLVVFETTNRDSLVPIVVRCVEAVFLGRKLYQHNRIPAIVTRLSVLALNVSPHAVLCIVAVIRRLMTRYSSVCRPLLDAEGEEMDGNSLAVGLPVNASDNFFDSTVSDDANIDPVLLRQDTTALWPLSQLRFHYHPYVRKYVKKALALEYMLPNESPHRLFEAYNPYKEGGFNPPIPSKSGIKTFGDKKKNNRNRNKRKKR